MNRGQQALLDGIEGTNPLVSIEGHLRLNTLLISFVKTPYAKLGCWYL
jgi:hypothetical protein